MLASKISVPGTDFADKNSVIAKKSFRWNFFEALIAKAFSFFNDFHKIICSLLFLFSAFMRWMQPGSKPKSSEEIA